MFHTSVFYKQENIGSRKRFLEDFYSFCPQIIFMISQITMMNCGLHSPTPLCYLISNLYVILQGEAFIYFWILPLCLLCLKLDPESHKKIIIFQNKWSYIQPTKSGRRIKWASWDCIYTPSEACILLKWFVTHLCCRASEGAPGCLSRAFPKENFRLYTQVRASKCRPCICYIQFSGILRGCDAQECNWMCSDFHMVKRNVSHKKGQHPQIRLTVRTFRVTEVFDSDTFLFFSSMDKVEDSTEHTQLSLPFLMLSSKTWCCALPIWSANRRTALLLWPAGRSCSGFLWSSAPQQGLWTREFASSSLKLFFIPK